MNSSGRVILVTGGNGFVGSAVIRLASSLGLEVHAICRQPSNNRCKLWIGDLRDRTRTLDILHSVKPAAVIHLAASGVAFSDQNSLESAKSNCEAMESLAAAAASLGQSCHLICAGSGFEYRPSVIPHLESDVLDPHDSYGRSKVEACNIAKIYGAGVRITWVRFFGIYGDGEKCPRLCPYIIRSSLKGETIKLSPCAQLRDYVYVDDVAQALVDLARQESTRHLVGLKTYNFASGSAIPLKDFVEEIRRQLGDRGLRADIVYGAMPYRSNERMNYTANIDLWQREFGWAPNRTLSEGLSKTIAAILSE